ncbi:hypothetical protein FQZ97_1115920 [compost metagenome]
MPATSAVVSSLQATGMHCGTVTQAGAPDAMRRVWPLLPAARRCGVPDDPPMIMSPGAVIGLAMPPPVKMPQALPSNL